MTENSRKSTPHKPAILLLYFCLLPTHLRAIFGFSAKGNTSSLRVQKVCDVTCLSSSSWRIQGPIHTGRGTRRAMRRKQMGPVDVNGGIRNARKQHQRKNFQFVPVTSRILCFRSFHHSQQKLLRTRHLATKAASFAAVVLEMTTCGSSGRGPPCPQDFFKIMQFSSNIFEQIWAQPPGVKTLLSPWPKSWIRPWWHISLGDICGVWGVVIYLDWQCGGGDKGAGGKVKVSLVLSHEEIQSHQHCFTNGSEWMRVLGKLFFESACFIILLVVIVVAAIVIVVDGPRLKFTGISMAAWPWRWQVPLFLSLVPRP